MSYATTALAGSTGAFGTELAKSLPNILEIAKAANKANPAIGSVDYQFQSLIIGLNRLSPRLIDNTGLQVKLGAAYEELAKKTGKSREELTAEEQQLALLNATLAAGGRLMEQVGGTAESLTDPFGRLRTATTNLVDALGVALAPAMSKVAESSAELINSFTRQVLGAQEVGAWIEINQDQLTGATKDYSGYSVAAIDAAIAQGDFSKSTIAVLNAMRVAAITGQDLSNGYEVLNVNAEDAGFIGGLRAGLPVDPAGRLMIR